MTDATPPKASQGEAAQAQNPPKASQGEAAQTQNPGLGRGDHAVQQALARMSEVTTDLGGARAELVGEVIAASPYLTRYLLAHPEGLAELAASHVAAGRDRERWLALLAEEVPLDLAEARFMEAMRHMRMRALVGVLGRELTGGDPFATGEGLSAFAEAAIEHALAFARLGLAPHHGEPRLADGTRCGATIIGLGRLGARELDPSCELELIFVYASDQGATDGTRGLGTALDLHTYHSRLFTRVTRLLSEETEEGVVFRIDLDHRPEGRTGPICNAAEAIEHYYESFGHEWDRLAWVKARAVAGDLELGQRVVGSLEPFVFRKHLDYGFADEVSAMKRRIDQSGTRLGQKDGFNVRLGRGGLREAEFATHVMQLAWGGRLPDLRARDTRTALQRISLAGLLDQVEADELHSAYRFLRRIEHALAFEEDRRMHVLAIDPLRRRRVAQRVMEHPEESGSPRPADGDVMRRFEAQLADHRKRVRTAFEAVAQGKDHDERDIGGPFASDAWDAAFVAALEPELEAAQREAALNELGFLRADAARSRLDALMRRPDSPLHPRHLGGAPGPLAGLGKKLIRAITQTPDPDFALVHVDGLLRALRHRQAALAQLAEDPRRLTALANLFGTSPFLSRHLVRSPGLLDRLVLDGKEPVTRGRAEMARLLRLEAEADSSGSAPLEVRLAAARRFHAAEVLRIGFFDLAGLIDDPAEQLSDLAEVIIEDLVQATRADFAMRAGLALDEVPSLTVVAMGELAGRELGYASTLELVFVVADPTDFTVATRLARGVVTSLTCATPEGNLYTVGRRVRTSGPSGPLCVTASRWRDYHLAPRDGDPPGEILAILRARTLGSSAPDLARQGVFGLFFDAPERAEAALQSARTNPDAGPSFGMARADFESGVSAEPGPEAIEHIVVRLQATMSPAAAAAAREGHAAGSASTLHALRGLAEVGALEVAESDALVEAYRFLRRLENRLALVQEVGSEDKRLLVANPVTWGAADRDRIRRLALRMGYGTAATRADGRAGLEPALMLQRDVERHRRAILAAGSLASPGHAPVVTRQKAG